MCYTVQACTLLVQWYRPTLYAVHPSTDTSAYTCLVADALGLLASFLLSSDRAVLQLLHVLDWRPVLQQLSPVTSLLQSPQAHAKPADQSSSLLDDDMSMSQPSGAAESATSQRSSRSGHSLDAAAKAWAAQLLLLVLQAYVVMTDHDLPEWITRLIKGDSEPVATGTQPMDACGQHWLVSQQHLLHFSWRSLWDICWLDMLADTSQTQTKTAAMCCMHAALSGRPRQQWKPCPSCNLICCAAIASLHHIRIHATLVSSKVSVEE